MPGQIDVVIPGDADAGVVDVVLGVVGPKELLVLVHPEGDDLVDALQRMWHILIYSLCKLSMKVSASAA